MGEDFLAPPKAWKGRWGQENGLILESSSKDSEGHSLLPSWGPWGRRDW